MTTELATIPQLHDTLYMSDRYMSDRDREAAQAVASRLRDAKAQNTRRAYASAWRQFQTWAEAGGHPALPATPQAVALYLRHLAAADRSIASVQQARSAVSHFHAAALTWGDEELWADGTGRLTIRKGKNQIEPQTVAVTAATARALGEIRPEEPDPAPPVFGLTGEALANLVRAAARAAGLGEGFSGESVWPGKW